MPGVLEIMESAARERKETGNVFMKHNMHGRGNPLCIRVVDAIPRGVRWVADHDATKRFLPKFSTELVGYLGEESAS
jgi:hypothetical protein